MSRGPAAARQLASRARRRVQGAKLPDADATRQRAVIDAFYAAVNAGDFDALVNILDPDVVVRADHGPSRPPTVHRGAATIARLTRHARGAELYPVLVNGLPGVVVTESGRPYAIYAFTIVDDRILEIDGIRDPDRVRWLVADVLQIVPRERDPGAG